MTIHVDLQDPVANLITLSFREKILIGKRDLVGDRDVGALKLGVF